MNKFGCSFTAHYRQLLSPEDVENLCYYFIHNPQVDILEIGYNGLSNYELFLSSYLSSEALRRSPVYKTTLNLHLPRRDWRVIGPEKIVADALLLDKLIGIKNFIVHAQDFQEFKDYLTPLIDRINIENDHSSFDFSGELVCDINHFLRGSEIDFVALGKYLSEHGSKIKEFHFAYLNHEMFRLEQAHLIDNIFIYLRGIVNLKGKNIIFEGANKEAVGLDNLVFSLEDEIKIIKSRLNICLA